MIKELNKIELGNRIQCARDSIRMSRVQLAAKVGRSPGFIADIEGGTKGPSIVTLYNIADALNVSIDYLLATEKSSQADATKRAIIFERMADIVEDCDLETLNEITDILRNIKHLSDKSAKK